MQTTANKSEAKPAPSKPANSKPPDIASASVPDTLATLHVNPDTGLTHAEVDVRRREHGYNEVAEEKEHPVLMFLGKFWGLSAWMLELIMALSVVLGNFPDLAVVGVLLIVNAVVSFTQERRAAGVVETLRRRLQINARVRREATWRATTMPLTPSVFLSCSISRYSPSCPFGSARWFWATLPGTIFLSTLAAETIAGTLLPFVRLPGLTPLPWWQTLAIFVYAMVACLGVNDAMKVAMIQWCVPDAVASNPVDLTSQIAKRG